MRGLRSLVTALLLLTGLTLGLLPAAAHAAGPGVTLFVNTDPRPIDIPGARFAGGMSLRSLLQSNGIDPATVTFVNVTREDAGQVSLTPSQLGARIIDDGTTTRFVHGSVRISATADTGPLQVSVDGGDISVVASASRSTINANESVTLSARVRFGPPGAQLRFEWDLNDGSPPKSGRSVTHVYKFGGQYQPRVTVTGTGGSTARCATSCIGHDTVDVTVGEPPPQQPREPSAGAGGGGVPGSGSGTGAGAGGGGQGGAGGAGSGTDTSAAEPEPSAAKEKPPPPPPPKKKPFGVTISGVLINDIGATVRKLPAGAPAGGADGPRRSRSVDADSTIELPLAGIAALAVFSLGALRERRGVRLRVA